MGQYESQRRNSGAARTKKQLSNISLRALQETADVFGKELTATDLKIWGGILYEFSDAAISWSLENWNRNGKFFPKPSEILELLHTFGSSTENQVKLCGQCRDGWRVVNPSDKPSDYRVVRCECVVNAIQQSKLAMHRCDAECQRRHGQGYNENDLRRLFKMVMNSGRFIPSMLDELDKVRGHAPEWRR